MQSFFRSNLLIRKFNKKISSKHTWQLKIVANIAKEYNMRNSPLSSDSSKQSSQLGNRPQKAIQISSNQQEFLSTLTSENCMKFHEPEKIEVSSQGR